MLQWRKSPPGVCVVMAGLTPAHWLVNAQQVCSLTQPQCPISFTRVRWGCLNQSVWWRFYSFPGPLASICLVVGQTPTLCLSWLALLITEFYCRPSMLENPSHRAFKIELNRVWAELLYLCFCCGCRIKSQTLVSAKQVMHGGRIVFCWDCSSPGSELVSGYSDPYLTPTCLSTTHGSICLRIG